jgi:hypothetical protein
MTIASALAAQVNDVAKRPSAYRAPSEVESAVRQASAKTGVDFAYLMEKAAVESGFRTDAKATTSNATGLYQFIDTTWLHTVKDNGAKYGLGRYANAIQIRSDGRPTVDDPALRQEILDLRKDPQTSAYMAAEFARTNKEHLERHVGGHVGSTELYMAHFLGAAGATKFLNTMKDDPNRKAADVFPEAAAANKAVFYDRDTGQAKTVKQIYDRFATRFSDTTGEPVAVATKAVAESAAKRDMPDGFTTQMAGMPSRAPAFNQLSIYQVLALNALETPDEVDNNQQRPVGGRRNDNKRMRDQPVRTDQTYESGLGLGLREPGLKSL